MGSLAGNAYPGLPRLEGEEFIRRATDVVNNILIGKQNITGRVTLNANAKSTTVSDARCSYSSLVLLMATSPTGAVALDQWSIQTITDGAFTITHISTSTADCTATYGILG